MKRLHLILLFTVLSVQAQSGLASEKHALLIGVGDYTLSSGFSDLKGSLNDVDIMHKTLKSRRFGFDRVTVLLNTEATHSRIAKAFTNLASEVRKDKESYVYIYYSGHGSLTRDLNGDEGKRYDIHGQILPSYDQTWVTYGSRLKNSATIPNGFKTVDRYDILDDEINEWINDIAEHVSQLVFVSDSCHSGSVSREGIFAGVKKGPVDTREHPLGRKNYRRNSSLNNIVRVGACTDSQIAREFIPYGMSEEYGIFTWYWIKSLNACLPRDTWNQVFSRVSRMVMQETPNRQSPQIAGAVSMMVFNDRFSADRRTVPVYQVCRIPEGYRVYMAAGRLSGVTRGSVYTLEKQHEQSAPPKIVVSHVEPLSSTAMSETPIAVNDQLVEMTHHYESSPIRLMITSTLQNSGNNIKKIRDVIQKISQYRVTESVKACDLIVCLTSISTHSSSSQTFRVSKSQDNWSPVIKIMDKNGEFYQENLIHPFSDKGLLEFKKNLEKIARIKDFMKINSDGNPCPLLVSVTPMVPCTGNGCTTPEWFEENWDTPLCPSKKLKTLTPLSINDFVSKKWDLCTMIRFNATNPGKIPYYFYVVQVGSDGEITPVFPSYDESGQIAEVKPGMKTSEGNAVIRLDSRSADHFKIIACRKAIDHRLFYQTGFRANMRTKGAADEPNPLEQILLNAISGTRNSVTAETGSWYAETITVDMR